MFDLVYVRAYPRQSAICYVNDNMLLNNTNGHDSPECATFFTFRYSTLLNTQHHTHIMARKFFVGGNFKMNGSKAALTTVMNGINATEFDPATVDVVVGAPACYRRISEILQNLDGLRNLPQDSRISVCICHCVTSWRTLASARWRRRTCTRWRRAPSPERSAPIW